MAFGWPSSFPTGVTIHDPDKVYSGYTLLAPINETTGEAIKLIDMEGNVVHEWDLDPIHPQFVKPLPGGRILGLDRMLENDLLVEADWDSQILWSYQADNFEMHHDFQRLEGGNTLICANTRHWIPTISLLPCLYDFFQELTPQHQVAWQWNTWDHYQDFGLGKEGMEWLYYGKVIYVLPDAFHTNSIQSLPPNQYEFDSRFQRGNILMSQRNTNIILIVDKDSGEIVWKTGPQDNLTIGQHDANMIEEGLPGAGNILVFDNGGSAGYPTKTRHYSRVLEINPMTKKVVWSYSAAMEQKANYTFYSHIISGAQRLPNGNTLICEGAFGRIFEVTEEGETVWEYIHSNPPMSIFRAYRVEFDWVPSNP